jgi:exosome complex component MTR3
MDRKRVNGPEASVAPLFKNVDKETVQILNSENKRLDDRSVEDVRPICKFIIFHEDPETLTTF